MSRVFSIILTIFAFALVLADDVFAQSEETTQGIPVITGEPRKSCPFGSKRFKITGVFTKSIDKKLIDQEAERQKALSQARHESIKRSNETGTKLDDDSFFKEALKPKPYDPTFKLLPWIKQRREELIGEIDDLGCPRGIGVFVKQDGRNLTRSLGTTYRLPYEEKITICCEDDMIDSLKIAQFGSKPEEPEEPLRTPAELDVTILQPLAIESLN